MGPPNQEPQKDAVDDIGPAFDQLPDLTWPAFLSWLEYVTLKASPADGKSIDSERAGQTLALPNRDAARRRWLVQVFELLESKTGDRLTDRDGQLLTELIRKYKDG